MYIKSERIYYQRTVNTKNEKGSPLGRRKKCENMDLTNEQRALVMVNMCRNTLDFFPFGKSNNVLWGL